MGRDGTSARETRHLVASIGFGLTLGALTVLGLAAFDSNAGGKAKLEPQWAAAEPDAPFEAAAQAGQVAEPEAAIAPQPEPEPPADVVTEGALASGDTLASALKGRGVAAAAIRLVSTRLAEKFDFRRAQPGDTFHLIQGPDGEVLAFRYNLSPVESLHLFLDGDEYVVRRELADLTAHVARIAGVVTSSLYGAVRDLGEQPQLANDFTDVFAWDVDFSRTVQPGDEFRVLYERLYRTDDDGNEVYVRPGRILAARYAGEAGEHTAVYFESEEGRGGYYRPDGTSVEGAFLLAPVRYSRITSRYSTARRHPILKITRPHQGIDYAAAIGTPVWSVADGEVIYRGWAGGFGNLVKIRHANGYVSYYGHLSRFSADLHVGSPVRQKQVIGYVGQTGLATGPHVCFRIAKDGRYVNPASLRSPADKPVAPEFRDRFLAARDTLLSELDAGPFVASGEAL